MTFRRLRRRRKSNKASSSKFNLLLETDLADQVACCRIHHKVGAAAVVARLLEAEPGGVPRRGQGGGHVPSRTCDSTRIFAGGWGGRFLDSARHSLREGGAPEPRQNSAGVGCGVSVLSRGREKRECLPALLFFSLLLLLLLLLRRLRTKRRVQRSWSERAQKKKKKKQLDRQTSLPFLSLRPPPLARVQKKAATPRWYAHALLLLKLFLVGQEQQRGHD